MERCTIFLNWKMQYRQDITSQQTHRRTQCNLSQNPGRMLCRYQKKTKIFKKNQVATWGEEWYHRCGKGRQSGRELNIHTLTKQPSNLSPRDLPK